MSVQRILVPVDFSDCSRAAVAWASELAQRFGASVDLLHVVAPLQLWVTGDLFSSVEEALDLVDFERSATGKAMKQLLQRLEDSGTPARGRLETGEPSNTILQVAEREGYDLIVLGAHERHGMSQLLHGRIGAAIFKHASCPVLTVRHSTGRARFSEAPVAEAHS